MEVSNTMPLPETAAAAPAEKKEGRLTQLILSLIIFAGFVVLLFVPDTALGTSLMLDEIIGLFKDFSPVFELMPVYSSALLLIVAAYAVLLVCTVVSIFQRNSAAAKLNLFKTSFLLLAILFYIFALLDAGLGFADIFYNADTYVALNSTVFSLALGVVALIVLLFTAHKSFGFVKLFSVLFAAGFIAVLPRLFIGLYDFSGIIAGADLGTETLDVITSIVFQAFAVALAANLVIALFSACARKTAVLDFVRACVVLVLAAAAFILLGVRENFANGFDFVGTVVCTGIALVQFVFALVVLLVLHAKKKAAAAQPETAQPSPFVVDANNQMALRGWEQPAYAQPAPEQPAPYYGTPAPEPTPAYDEAARTNDALEAAAQLTFDDITAQEPAPAEPEPAPASSYESVIRDEQQEQPGEKEAPKDEKPFDFEQARYDGTFNRAYADYAQQQEPQQQPEYRTAQPYYQAPRTYAQPAPAQNAAPYYDTAANAGYVPDAFINGLTAAERDEFNKLFISRIYGENKRLPAYVVGGDNREFFAKIFVFMGRYRNVISDGLLEKIYEYSNLIR